MNQHPAVLLCSVALAGAAALLYVANCRRESTSVLQDIREAARRSANSSQASYRLLKKQRRDLRALNDYILPVPKGVEKPAS